MFFLDLLAEFTPHSDSITCLDFFDKDERTYILTSSSDCSVVLSDVHGNAYGTFGQPNQWRVDMDLTKVQEELMARQNTTENNDDDDEKSKTSRDPSNLSLGQDLDAFSNVSDEEILTRRSNVWESTSIGKVIVFLNDILTREKSGSFIYGIYRSWWLLVAPCVIGQNP